MKCYACGEPGMQETVEQVDLDGVARVDATVRHCPACGGWETYPPRRTEEFDPAP